MYRAGLEWILGFRLRGATLIIDPCVPKAWPGFSIAFKYRSAHYDITVANPKGVSRGVARISLDEQELQTSDGRMPLADDAGHHRVEVVPE